MSKQKSTNLNAFVSKFGFSLLLIFTISFHSKGQDIVIETQNSALVFRVSSAKTLQQIYLGEALSSKGDYQQLPNAGIDTWITGGMNTVREPALQIKQADGNPSLDLEYVSHQKTTDGNVTTTTIELKDPKYAILVKLFFKAFQKENVIESWSTLLNKEKKPVVRSEEHTSELQSRENLV